MFANKQYDYAQIPAGYYDDVFHRGKGVQSKWHHMKFAKFHQALQGASSHLDIGCGPGTFIGMLGPEHHSVGVDIASPQIAFARSRYGSSNKSFECTGGDLASFADATFDAVTIIELLEHLPPEENKRLLLEAVRVLKPGGRLIVSTPNYGGAWPLIEAVLNRAGPISYADQHITHYSRRSLRALMNVPGLGQVSVSAYMFAAPFTACLGWKFADRVARLEPDYITSRCGLLLFSTAVKL